MPNVNRVILIGNLTRDPLTKQLPGNSLVCEFGLAMNRKFKSGDGAEKEDVCFVDCAAFGRQAEVIQKWCHKGKQLYVEGRLKYDTWDDKSGHGKRSKISVVVENFQFLGGRDESGEPVATGQGSKNQDRAGRANWSGDLPERPQKSRPQQPFGERLEFKEADIPF
jgi:single-strand DNA-binding protein